MMPTTPGNSLSLEERKKRRLSSGWGLKVAAHLGSPPARKSIAPSGGLSGDLDENDDQAEKERMRSERAMQEQRRKTLMVRAALDDDSDEESLDTAKPPSSVEVKQSRTPFKEVTNLPESKQSKAQDGADKKGSKAKSAKAPEPIRLSNQQLATLYDESIKLAVANKINVKNTWGLRLIDHMTDMIDNEDMDDIILANANSGANDNEEDDESSLANSAALGAMGSSSRNKALGGAVLNTNFQRASCALDASVKIYSYRVDSVHKDTYKVLGGLNRSDGTDQPAGADDSDDDDNVGPLGENGVGSADGMMADKEQQKKEKKRAIRANRHTATLEANPENLSVKKLELEFEIDPLFKKTSASFDEGGAKGLLLNNLCVYDGCRIVFDSSDAVLTPLSTLADVIGSTAKSSGEIALNPADLRAVLCQNPETGDGKKWVMPSSLCSLLQEMHTIADAYRRDEDPLGSVDPEEEEKKAEEKMADKAASDAAVSSDVQKIFSEPLPTIPSASDSLSTPNKGDALSSDSQDPMPLSLMSPTPAELEEAESKEMFLRQHLSEDASDDDGDFGFGGGDDYDMPAGNAGAAAAGERPSKRPANLEGSSNLFGTEDNEFSYFDQRALGNWAGAAHWKFKAPATRVTKASSADADGSQDKIKKKRKAAFSLDFVGLLSAEPLKASVFAAPPRTGNTLTEAALSKQSEEQKKFLLPEDVHFTAKQLQTLFLRPRLLVRLKNVASNGKSGSSKNKSEAAMAVESSDDNMDTESPTSDEAQFVDHSDGIVCVAQQEPAFGDIKSIAQDDNADGALMLLQRAASDGADDSDDEDAGPMDGGAGFDIDMDPIADSGAQGGNKVMANLGLQLYDNAGATSQESGLALVSRPKYVDKVDIQYAKFAKKLDVRALKTSIWSVLAQPTPSKAKEAVEPAPLVPAITEKPKSFQDTIASLSEKLPSDVIPNLSVSFCFICLLHLANENDLTLEAKPRAAQLQGLTAGDCAVEKAAETRHEDLGDFVIFKTQRA